MRQGRAGAQNLPKAKALLGEWGSNAGRFRTALTANGITLCIPSKANRKIPISHDRPSIASGTESRDISAGSRTNGTLTPRYDSLRPHKAIKVLAMNLAARVGREALALTSPLHLPRLKRRSYWALPSMSANSTS